MIRKPETGTKTSTGTIRPKFDRVSIKFERLVINTVLSSGLVMVANLRISEEPSFNSKAK